MSKIKVSIIIPVWSKAKSDDFLLRRTFDCCIKQTLNDIEIIAVNDESPNPLDQKIMEEYKEKFPNKFHCLYLSPNIGQGAARNRGMELAHGDYICFIDCDDIMDHTFCEKLYREAIESDADMVGCKYYNESLSKYGAYKANFLIESWKIHFTAGWSRIVRREFLQAGTLLHFIEAPILEDLATYFWALSSNKTVYIDEVLYHWCVRSDSCSSGIFRSDSDFTYMIPAFEEFLNRMDTFAETSHYTYCSMFIIAQLTDYFKTYYELSNEDKKWKLIKQFKALFNKLNFAKISATNFLINSGINNNFPDECPNRFEKWLNELNFLLYFEAFKKPVSELNQYLIDNNSSAICLWGGGKNGTFFTRLFTTLNIQIKITDTDPKQYNKIIGDKITVEPWNDIRAKIKTVIVCTSVHYNDVKALIGDNYYIIDLHKYFWSGLSAQEWLG